MLFDLYKELRSFVVCYLTRLVLHSELNKALRKLKLMEVQEEARGRELAKTSQLAECQTALAFRFCHLHVPFTIHQ